MVMVFFLLTGLLLIKQCEGQDRVVQCGNCMDTSHGSHCNNDAVQSCVCDQDHDCCDKHWDSLCVLAVTHPDKCNLTCGEEHCGDCLTVQSKNGCSNKRIESCVCEIDPACCNNEWDSLCVDEVQRFESCWRGGCDNRTIADPVAVCKNVTVFLNASGVESTAIDAINNGSSTDTEITTLSLDDSLVGCEDVSGNKPVSLTVTDARGETDTCTAIVTVQDSVEPTAICQNVTVSLNSSGFGSITPENINAGSSDACGISNLSLNETSFSCQDVGSKPVRLTVTDNNGNNNTCISHVKVQGCGEVLSSYCVDVACRCFSSGPLNKKIGPLYDVDESSITVPDDFNFEDIKVAVNLQHNRLSNLRIKLFHYKYDRMFYEYVTLFDSHGDLGDNLENTVFDQQASQSIENGSAPFTGSFQPVQSLAFMYKENSDGPWELQITNKFQTSGGVWRNWHICFVATSDVDPFDYYYYYYY